MTASFERQPSAALRVFVLLAAISCAAKVHATCTDMCLGWASISYDLSALLTADGSVPTRTQLDDWTTARSSYPASGPFTTLRPIGTVAADGTARLLLRVPFAGECTPYPFGSLHSSVRLTITTPGDPAFTGRLISLDGSQSGTSVTDIGLSRHGCDPIQCSECAPPYEDHNDHWVIYEAPSDFGPQGPSPTRTVTIQIESTGCTDTEGYDICALSSNPSSCRYYCDLDNDPCYHQPTHECVDSCMNGVIQIRRPPVVLLPGLWSNADVWEKSAFEAVLFHARPGLVLHAEDLKDASASFADNAPEVRRSVQKAIDEMKNEDVSGPAACSWWVDHGTAVAQADLVGHSMGGVLARIVATDPGIKKPANFMKGTIHSITTIDTPHCPAFMAQAIEDKYDDVCTHGSGPGDLLVCTELKALVRIAAGTLHDPIKRPSALYDLAHVALPAYEGRAFPLAGRFDGLPFSSRLPGSYKAMYSHFDRFGMLPSPFPDSDGIVDVLSQSAGLGVSVFPDTLHSGEADRFGCVEQSAYQNATIALLDDSSRFRSGFPASSDFCPAALAGLSRLVSQAPRASVIPPGPQIVVTQPVEGSTFAPGDTVTFSVEAAPGAVASDLMIASQASPNLASSATLPFSTTFTIPSDFAGPLLSVVSVFDGAGTLVDVVERTIVVVPTAALESLEVRPTDARLVRPGDERVLYVSGQYADGVERTIAALQTGTTYVSSDPTIVTVSTDGRLYAESYGQATVTVANGARSVEVAVTVAPDPDEPEVPTTTTSVTATTSSTTTSTTLAPPLCGPVPATGCHLAGAGGSVLQIKDAVADAVDQLSWRWGRGDATAQAEFKDPVDGSPTYRVCLYDASGAAQPLTEMVVPPGGRCGKASCWKRVGTSGFLYNDKPGSSDGITGMKLKAGVVRKASVALSGKGVNLPMPSPGLTLPVTVQLVIADDGGFTCWQTTYTRARPSKPGQFFAVGP